MISESQVGKDRRLKRLFSNPDGKVIFVPLDDSLLSGPTGGLEVMRKKIELITQDPPDALMGFPGLFKMYGDILWNVPSILNITASTTRSDHTHKVLVGSVKQAVKLGMDAVAVHVNITSKFESDMIRILGAISQECDEYGMPLLGIMYPRKEAPEGDDNYLDLKKNNPKEYAKIVAHAARVGTELGADFIKTQYTGTPDSFRFVLEACEPIPVVVAGGVALEPIAMLQMAYDVISAGGRGFSFGRNVFSRNNPQPFISALKAIVHSGATPKDVLGMITEKNK